MKYYQYQLIHAGKLEAIVLVTEIDADYVLMDDLLARRKAQRAGLGIIGIIGALSIQTLLG